VKPGVILVLICKLLEQALSFHMHFWNLAMHQWHVEKVPLEGIAQLHIQTLPPNSTRQIIPNSRQENTKPFFTIPRNDVCAEGRIF
jgi:hypothetical protein